MTVHTMPVVDTGRARACVQDPALFAEQVARLTPDVEGKVARVPWAPV